MILVRRFIYTFLVSMIPAIEIKVGIPFGIVLGLKPATAFIAGMCGTTIILIALALLGQWFFKYCRKKGWLKRFLGWTDRLTEKHEKMLNRLGALFLFAYVAVPVPGTGTWTGGIIGSVIHLKPRMIILSIFCGNIISGLIMVFVGEGVAGVLRSNIPFFNNLLNF